MNRGLDSDNLLSDEEEYQRQHQHQQQQQQQQQQQRHQLQARAGRLGHGGKAASQLSVASRNHLANGAGISYRHEAPMLNDKYFPRDPFAGGNNYIGPAATRYIEGGGGRRGLFMQLALQKFSRNKLIRNSSMGGTWYFRATHFQTLHTFNLK